MYVHKQRNCMPLHPLHNFDELKRDGEKEGTQQQQPQQPQQQQQQQQQQHQQQQQQQNMRVGCRSLLRSVLDMFGT